MTPGKCGLDSLGWFVGTLHHLIGHDAAAAVIGASSGDKAECLMCQYEREPTDLRRRAVTRALRPTSIGELDDGEASLWPVFMSAPDYAGTAGESR